MKYINLTAFIISLALGLFYSYLTIDEKKVIYVYPRLDNLDKVQYVDESGSCFKYKEHQVACPSDEKQIESYVVQN